MKRGEILDAAKAAVTGKRVTDYGKPENNFGLISLYWTTYLGILVTAEDVALMMALFKIGRIQTGTATEDSFADACGYLACAGEICTEEEEDHENETGT